MSGFDDYESYDATGLAQLIGLREISAAEVLEAAIARVEERNPALNAVVATLFDAARSQALRSELDGPLAGVPFLLKDLNTYCVGAPATNGSFAFKEFYPDRDGELVSRYRRGGLLILGKTNTPELGLNIATEPALFGPTLNPHDPARSPGGSSGGSAAAVASGMVPAAHATDSGGSIRIPASNCALFGLKPTRARNPLGHDAPEGIAGMSVAHAVSHTVRDSALLLDITAGPLPGDPYRAPAAEGPFVRAMEGDLPPLRVALWTEGFAREAIAEDCREAARLTARRCEELGCRVEEARPELGGVALREAFDVVFSGNIHNVVEGRAARYANPTAPSFEPVTLDCAERAARFTAADYAAAVQIMHRAARSLGAFFQRYDVFVTPTLANPPLPVGSLDMKTPSWPEYLERLLAEIPFTPLYNATGCPAASVPMHRTAGGLPVGAQIGAALGREDLILRLAAALEEGWPWHDKRGA